VRRLAALALVVATALFACAGQAAPLTLGEARADKAIAAIHSVGVVSLVGTKVTVASFGITVFGNSRYDVDTPDWGLDAQVDDAVVDALSPRFHAVAIPLDPKAYQDRATDFFAAGAGQIRDLIRARPDSPDVDAYLMILPGSFTPAYPLRGGDTGLGLFHGAAYGDPPFAECLGLNTFLIDAKTGDQIYFAIWLGPPPEGSDAPWGGLPMRALPADFAPPSAGGMTPAQSHMLRDDFLSLIRASVGPSLMRARLLPHQIEA